MEIVFQEHPDVFIGSNMFRKVPVLIQYKETPVLEVGQFAHAGFTTQLTVFHADGTKIAVVKGARIFLTNDAQNAAVTQRFEPNLTVCELEGKPILELRREGAAALKGWAELYAPEGVLIKSTGPQITSLVTALDDGELCIGTQLFAGGHFEGHQIGIHCLGNGSYRLGMRHLQYSAPANQPIPDDIKEAIAKEKARRLEEPRD